MLNYNQALPEQTLLQDLQMKEIKPIMKLVIRGKNREFISFEDLAIMFVQEELDYN